MMYIRWFVLSIIGLFLTIVQIILSPILALFTPRLPSWLSWFQTVDYDLLGDDGHYKRWVWLYTKVPTILAIYIQQLAWLLRNPTDGYDYKWQYKYSPNINNLVVTGDILTSNRPIHSGVCKVVSNNHWMYYKVFQYSNTRCLRIYLGWKMMNIVSHPEQPNTSALVCVINPFSGLSR